MPTGRRRLASSLRAAEPSSPNEAKALSNNPADNNHPRFRPPNLRWIGESKPRNVSFLREATRANQGPAGSP